VSGSSIQPISDEEKHRERTHPTAAADLIGDPVACSCELAIESGPGGDIVVVRVAGEIDLLSLHVLRDALSAAADRNPADLVVDLAGVAFCCAQGFALLAQAVRTAQNRNTGFALCGLTLRLDRVATLLTFEECCVRYRSVAAAVHAIRVEHTYRPA
jgi:anti-sigma B factor antagonist